MKIELEKVDLGYSSHCILSSLSWEVESGKVCCLMGASGCGKSTLLRAVAGLLVPLSGRILIGGSVPSPRNQRIAWVPQNYGLLPWKNLKENIELGLRLRKERVCEEKVQEMLRYMNLDSQALSYPSQVSGGQQQRTALARAFLQSPDVLLLDEPFSSLDKVTASHSRFLFNRLRESRRVTTLWITHRLSEAMENADEICFLSGNPTRIVEIWKAPFDEDCMKKRMEELSHG